MKERSRVESWWNEVVIRHPELYLLEAIGRWALWLYADPHLDGWDTRPLSLTLLRIGISCLVSAGCVGVGLLVKWLPHWQSSYIWSWVASYLTDPQADTLVQYELQTWSVYCSCGYNSLVYFFMTRSLRRGPTNFHRTLYALLLVGHGLFLITLPLDLLSALIGPETPLGPTDPRFGD